MRRRPGFVRPNGAGTGRRAAFALALALSASAGLACEDQQDRPPPGLEPVCGEAPEPPVCARVADAVVLRQVTHPGRGVEVDLRLLDACGAALPASYSACIEPPANGAVAARELAIGHTLILIAPGESQQARADVLDAVEALLEARPATERIAIQRWGDQVGQLSDFTRDRIHLATMARMGLGEPDAHALAPSAVVDLAAGIVEAVGGVADLGQRSLIVIAPPGVERPGFDGRASTLHWIDPAAAGGVQAALLAVSDAIDAERAAGVAALGVCGASDATVTVPDSLFSLSVPLVPPLDEEAAMSCDAAVVARGERAYPRRIELEFTPEQRAVYEQRVAVESKADFEVSVRMGDAAAVPAVAHLRGHGSLHCARKSYTVDLDGPMPRHIVAGAATDEFFLMSNCYDNEYTQGFTATQLLHELDLMPFHFDYVEVVLDGRSEGVYLMMEKHREELVRDHARAQALVRRRHENEGEAPRLKWQAEGSPDPMPYYEALVDTAASNSGETLIDEMWRRMSLSTYLDWAAGMTAIKNGDYGDEVFFFATQRAADVPLHFTPVAWDPDDMLRRECVWIQYAFYDAWGLVYCAEGVLENVIFQDPMVYDLYVDALERALEKVTVDRFKQAQEHTAARLLPFFEDAEIRQASIEIGSPATYAEAEETIKHRLGMMERRFIDWRAQLVAGLAAYRAAHGP